MSNGFKTDPIFRIPSDWVMTRVSTPYTEVYDWSIRDFGIPEQWKQTRGAVTLAGGIQKPIRICVCDTGVDLDHPDLDGQILDAKDHTGSMYGPQDVVGHGTWCASFLVAQGENNLGVRGIADQAKVVVEKVLGDNGSGTELSIMRGMKHGRDNYDVDVYSLSLGGGQMSEYFRGFLRELAQEGRMIFCAAGNEGAGRPSFPARWWEYCIPVGSCDKQGRLSRFTNRGPELLKGVVGPGEDMLACGKDDDYVTMSGTSMATPFVAGVGTLALAKHRSVGGNSDIKTIDDMREHLQRSAKKTGEYVLVSPESALNDPINAPTPDDPLTQQPIFNFLGVNVFSPARKGDWLSIDTADDQLRERILNVLQVP